MIQFACFSLLYRTFLLVSHFPKMPKKVSHLYSIFYSFCVQHNVVDDVPSWIDFENSPVTGSNPDHLKRLYKLVRDRADPQTGIIMYTSTTSNYMDMYDNWVCSMARTQGLKLREKKKKKDKQTNKIIEGLGGVGDDPRRTSVQLPQSGPSSHNEQGERYFMSLDNVPAQSIAVTTPGPNPFEHRQRKPDHPAKRLCDDNYEVIPSEDGLLTPFKNFVVYTSDAPTVKLLQQRGDPVFTDHAVEIGKLGKMTLPTYPPPLPPTCL